VMRLQLDPALAEGYRSPAQRARRITEGWFRANMFCPACPSEKLGPTPDNTRVVDFVCPACGAEFQLKARSGRFGRKLRDAAYAPMMRRILENRCPHFAFLRYDTADWRVTELLLVPGHFVTRAVIERSRPLSRRARRAGWIGCNILLPMIPPHGRVHVVANRTPAPPPVVRAAWARFYWLAGRDVESRGWTADVLRCLAELGRREFTLAEVYAFEGELARLHPANRNIRAKIRQQLQVLRDRGIVRFLSRGRYALLK